MSRRRLTLAVVLISAVILTACGTDNPHFDWCYNYNFTISSYGAAIPYGSWTTIGGSTGFTPDSSGRLAFSIDHDEMVYPSLARVTVTRPAGTTGDVGVTASGVAFGILIDDKGAGDEGDQPGVYDSTLPALLDEVDVDFPVANTGDGGSVINVSMSPSDTLQITALSIRGNGANPFPENHCAPDLYTPSPSPEFPFPTDTDEPDTPSPTFTPSATVTPSVTFTPTVTPTMSPTWTQLPGSWNFWGDDGWNGGIYYDDGNYHWTGGHAQGNANGLVGGHYQISIFNGEPATLHLDASAFSGRVITSLFMDQTQAGGDKAITVTVGSYTATWTSGVYLHPNVAADTITLTYVSAAVNISRIMLTFGDVATPTPTSTPSETLTPSSAPSNTPSVSTSTSTSNSPTSTRTRTPGPTRTPTRTPISIGSPLPTYTPPVLGTLPPPSGTVTGPTSTASSPPASSTASRTPQQAPTYYPTAAPSAEPDDENSGEIAILNTIGDFFTWVVNSFSDFGTFIGDVVRWVQGTAQNGFTWANNLFGSIGAFLGFALQAVRDILDVIRLILAIGQHLIDLVLAWLGQFLRTAQNLINAWYSTPAEALPFMPQCYSAPTSSDICAVYYVLDNTILSGTIGGLFVPTLTLLIDVGMVLYFIRTVRNLIKKAGTVAQ